ncbi:MAG: Rne/Rng family ribonuclease [Solirubrobacterales bacterium]
MVKRMLIDATHPEETRVVVVNGTRLEELDVETSTKKQLKGNIYLAKVVRVEPSLQAAFVEYGGNRHGFLAFSEIHPDYFQIPVADRQALLAAQRAEVMREGNGEAHDSDAEPAPEGEAEAAADGDGTGSVEQVAKPASVEVLGGDEASEQELERRRARLLRNYKIQEVIKRRQIMLVQVVKEERGNKGAALTTYLSLAGRYCVLMPNTARGGGVSRKITNANDRRRLKAIATEMDIPDGMAVIVRTAGSERSKAEIKRDYEYLLRMWDNVRELTLKSSAPALVYEEASLIKRSIRDLYSRDIDEVLVEGDEGYRLAKDYMRMLTPSHAKKVQPFKDPTMPMFHRYQVESQLDAMHSPVVQLRSGGYIVISQTEALVAIDVNSGRSTKERHIEETALKTNLEAADEVARQLRLRDLAGLVVIDFIDMEENRNNHAVERRLKEALKHDRARIQVGKISAFGLLELSRQRLRPSLQETTFSPCPHCAGTGLVRSVESAAVHVLRAIEEEGIRRRSSEVTVYVPTAIALYILNQKRDALAAIEERYQFRVYLQGDDELIPPNFRMDRIKAENRPEEPRPIAISMEAPAAVEEEEEEEEAGADEEELAEARGGAEAEQGEGESEGEGENRKRRRRRRRKRRGGEGQAEQPEAAEGVEAAAEEAGEADEGEEEGAEDEGADEAHAGESEADRRKRRRGRRGGRRRRRNREQGGETEEAEESVGPIQVVTTHDIVADVFEAAEAAEEAAIAARAAQPAVASAPESEPEAESAADAAEPPAAKPARQRRAPRRKAKETEAAEAPAEAPAEAEAPAAAAAAAEVVATEAAPKRKRASTKKAKAAEAPEAEAPAKPKEKAPRTRARKPKAEPAAEAAPAPEEPVAEAPAAEEPVAPAAEAVPEQAEAAPAPAPVPAEQEPPAPATPAKRGWWNRLLS